MSSASVEEKILFYDEIEKLTQGFYQYMHGDRTQPDGAITLFKRFAEFYNADWIGLLDIDCSFRSWSAQCFYNAVTGSTTETLIEKPERFETAPSWVEAVKSGVPIIVEDIEAIKDSLPIEYEMYKRLEVKSVIGVPYRNMNMGLMVVKNPKRFKSEALALNVMSYITTMEVIEVNRRKNIQRHVEATDMLNYNDVRIKLFGEFTIESKDLLIKGEDVKSELIKFAVAYMTVNVGKSFPKEKLSSVYYNGTDTACWPDIIYKFRQKCRELRPAMENQTCDLINTYNSGYGLCKKLNIESDVDTFEKMVKLIDDTGIIDSKIDILKDFYVKYQDDFLPGMTECEWILTSRQDYRRRYIEKMSLMLRLLHGKRDYTSVVRYGTDILKRFPHSVEIRYWQVVALWELGEADILKHSIDAGKEILQEHEWGLFIELLAKNHSSEEAKKYIRECIGLRKIN